MKKKANKNTHAPIQDPQAEREAQRYERPIASREAILMLFERVPELSFPQIRDRLQLREGGEIDALRRRVRAMCRDGQLFATDQGAYRATSALSLVQGKVGRSARNLILDSGGEVAIDETSVGGLVEGDRISARLRGSVGDENAICYPVAILARRTAAIVGALWEDAGRWYVQPDRIQSLPDIQIVAASVGSARSGDYVLARLLDGTERMAEVTQVLGPPEEAYVEREVILQAHGIPREFDAETLLETGRLPAQPNPADYAHRVDLRDLPLVTIDGEDARDFDDAVYAETRRGGYRLLVAIADVGHYVQVGTALDLQAQQRGNSVYFPDLVIPMLPEALSNGLCSLRPEEDRLCLVCDMSVSNGGRVTNYQFYEGVMRSSARLTYNLVAEALGLNETSEERRLAARARVGESGLKRLTILNEVYELLRRQREQRGGLDFQPTETRILFNERGRIDRIVLRERNDAHRLIEECMIAANVCAAKLLSAAEVGGVYRVHEPPDFDRYHELLETLAMLGVTVKKRKNQLPEPKDIQAILLAAQARPSSHVIESMVLRSLMQARYGAASLGHFGLALADYTHFTSPIRRYADLLVHRALRYLIRKGEGEHVAREKGAKKIAKAAIFPYSKEQLEKICADISFTERRADMAVRDLEEWLKCDYMSEHLGSTFDATIASITSFGVFAEIDGMFVQGLIHISTLGTEYYRYDAKRMELRGERSGHRFGVGQRIRVKVARVDIYQRRIDLALDGVETRGNKRGLRRRKER